MPGASRTTDPPDTPEAVELLTAGSTFARYEVVRCIGVGGMGAVFEATHTLLRKRVAIKTLHASLGRSETSRARFVREAETVARIRHANVVDITDVGVERGIPFLVMEFLEGEDLASLLAREGRLGVPRAIDLLLPAVAGLCAVHRLGIVHRDLKPENIFLARDALGHVVPKLVDFGVSKDLDAAASNPAMPLRHTVAGTPYYMAPEQARGSAVLDGRADQYALGVVLYQCLSLLRPFESESLLELIHMIDGGHYVALDERCPELPPELCAVVARAMARRAEDRFASTEAFGQALAAFASEAVARACAREFAVESRPALPRGFGIDPERLSAPTVPEAALPAAGSPTAGVRSRSGVQPRDSGTSAGQGQGSHTALPPRRVFWLSALFTFMLLCSVGAYWLWRSEPRPHVVSDEPRRAPTGKPGGAVEAAPREPDPEQRTPAVDTVHSAPASPAPALERPTAAGDEPGLTPAPRSGRDRSPRPRREPKPGTPAPVDIQLSR